MPASRRIYPVRPLGRRYGYYGQQGSGFDAAGMMKSIGALGQEFAKAMAARKAQQQQDALNAQANQMENTVFAPRAGAVGPVVNPATGQVVRNIAPTTGTAPFSTGAAGMKLQQDFIRSNLENQRLAQEVRNQGIASSMAQRRGGGGDGGGGGNASRWKQYLGGDQGAGNQGKSGGKTAKEPAYQPYQYDAETDPRADAFPHIAADFDAKYGKGAYAKVAPHLATATADDKGNLIISKDPTDPTKTIMTLPPDQAAYWRNRYNAGSISAGQPHIGSLPTGTNPNSGQPDGSQVNPIAPKNNLELRALPFGTWITDPATGKTIQKQPLTPPSQQTSEAGDQSGQGPGLVSAGQLPALASARQGAGLAANDQGTDYTGGQSQLAQTQPQMPPDQGGLSQSQLADEIRRTQLASQLERPQPPVDLASVSPSNTPGSFDLGGPSNGGLPPELQLGDEIKRTQLANSLQGLYA